MGTFPSTGHTPHGRQCWPLERDDDRGSARPAPYLRVPDRLLRTFAHDPLTVGVYLAVARCAVAAQAPAPLSPADLAAWERGVRSRDVALMRRIRRLLALGWLVAEAGRAVKLRLSPTWGDATQPWQFAVPRLGKPDAVRTRRVPLDLFDIYLGRIDPQPGRTPALLTRYFDRPLLGFTDLGIYAISQITAIPPTEALVNLGLVCESGPQLPPPLMEVLTAVADGQIAPPVALSLQGYERLGRRYGSPNGSCSGSPNGSPNGSWEDTPEQVASSAVEREETQAEHSAIVAAWDGWDRRIEGHESPTPKVEDSTRMRGRVIRMSAESFRPAALDPERAQVLTAMGIRQQHTLAHVPLDRMQVWQVALAHPGMAVRFDDPVAFAASQLRRGIDPPTLRELEHWAGGGSHADRHYASVAADYTRHAALLAQAQEIAGNDDLLVSYVAAALDEGMDAISALIHAQREVEQQEPESDEEVYRALRARAGR